MNMRLGCLAALMVLAGEAGFADVKITRLANEGVILDDGVTRIMIDGLVVETYALYGGLPDDMALQFRHAEGVFEDIDLALASHRHHDHNQPEFACTFMKRSANTRLLTSMQVLDLMRERCRQFVTSTSQVRVIEPSYEQPVVIREGSAHVSVFLLSHGTGKYARLQNFGHLVNFDGMKILHIGDAAMAPEDFEKAKLHQVELDVALIPFWFFQPGPGMAVVKRFMDARHQFAVHIPPAEMEEVSAYLAENFPEVRILTNPGDEAVISRPAAELPTADIP